MEVESGTVICREKPLIAGNPLLTKVQPMTTAPDRTTDELQHHLAEFTRDGYTLLPSFQKVSRDERAWRAQQLGDGNRCRGCLQCVPCR